MIHCKKKNVGFTIPSLTKDDVIIVCKKNLKGKLDYSIFGVLHRNYFWYCIQSSHIDFYLYRKQRMWSLLVSNEFYGSLLPVLEFFLQKI